MGAFFILLGMALAIFLLVVFIRHLTTSKRILIAFKSSNVIVTGKQGRAKDVLFSWVINKRKEEHLSNIVYNEYTQKIALKDFELTHNDYKTFISGKVNLETKKDFENKDFYISDGGVYLPSQMDSILHKEYKSLPIAYALERQLYNAHIHVNCQCLERLWKALREQADYYVHMRKKPLILPHFLVVFTREYDKYESAKQLLLPLGTLMFNKYSKAQKKQYDSTNGFIKDGLIIIPKRILKYDTREFHKIIFGQTAPRKESIWTRLKHHFSKKEKTLTN